jgi:T5SS/PEP-CTERM-associated repeat protein
VGGASGGFDGLVVGNSGQGALTVNGGTLMLDGGINLGGNSGSAGTLTLNGGEIMLNGGINVGAPGALGTAWVTGGQVICTNLFALLFIGGGQNVGLMVVSNGLVSASQIYVESSGTLSIQGGEVSDVGGASSPIDTFYGGTIIFNSGRLETASLVGSQLFVIGDGTHAATMQLLGGGTLDFSFSGDGIIVASNSFLTGCGYIKASPVLNFGTITNDCAGGTLTFAYDVTNTGLVVAASGAIIDFNGPTINNGVIDARAGNVNFKSAFTNNGTVLGISLTEIYAPVADFTASPPSGPSPLTATFTDASWGVITNQFWSFGDGSTLNTNYDYPTYYSSSFPSVSHTYTEVGTHTVSLITSGPYGVSTNTQVALIMVAPSQFNTYINSASGKWQDAANWSLGVPPDSMQAGISITNAASKTVTIDSTTSSLFTNTLAVSNLTVSAQAGQTNTLALLNAGTNTPLQVGFSTDISNGSPGTIPLVVGSGGLLEISNSVMEVNGVGILAGPFDLAGGDVEVNGSVVLRESGTLELSFTVTDVEGLSNETANIWVVGGTLTDGGSRFESIDLGDTAQMTISNGSINLATTLYVGGTFTVAGGNSEIISCLSPIGCGVAPGLNVLSNGTVWITGGSLSTFLDNQGQMTISNGVYEGKLLTEVGGNFTIVSGLVDVFEFLVQNGGNSFVKGGQLTVTNGVIGIGNDGSTTNGVGAGHMMVSNGTVLASTILLGSSAGGAGDLTISSNGVVDFGFSSAGTNTALVANDLILDGGLLMITNGTIYCGLTHPGAMTLSNGVAVCEDIYVGDDFNGSLLMVGGTMSVASLLHIGEFAGSTGVVWITGGDLLATNLTTFIGNDGVGQMTISNGSVTVSRVVVSNSSNPGTLSIQGGTLSAILTISPQGRFVFGQGHLVVTATTSSNGQPFVAGDGSHAATMKLQGGTYAFDAGLTVSANALLTGCGTINGTVVNLGTITNDCGTLSFNGVITNNGTIVVSSGATAVFAGPLVNNGLIDATDGTALFSSNLVNNGTLTGQAPVPNFSGSPRNGAATLLVNFTDASSGTVTSSVWDFGDGGTSILTSPSHSYTIAGTFSVSLTVLGPLGSNTLLRSNYVTVTNVFTAPVAALTASPTNGAASLLVNFTDASTGTITDHSWNFGDGNTSTLTSPSHTYSTAGVYSVALTVSGPGGSNTLLLANYIAVTNVTSATPVAAFTASPTNGAATLLVNFTDSSSGTVTSRVWTFGDGGTSTLASPSHSYSTGGTFPVSLTVFGPLGSNTLLLPNYITVTNVFGSPVAAFNANPTDGAWPLLVNFTDASTGTITNHLWTFGDGNTSTLISPSHTYSTASVYSVALTVSGPGGSSVTNRPNLITVTNAVNTPPTVSIVRPADGMLYPPTNQIGIVVSATANDGGAITNIEFFLDGRKLGETTANPGITNISVGSTFSNYTIMARVTDTLGVTNVAAATITVGAKNSPLGDWEVTISGADKGAQFLTFEDDFTASGYGIRLKTFGLDDVTGHWGFKTNNTKGQVTGPFVEQTDGTTNWTGVFLGPVKSLKNLSGAVPATNALDHSLGTFHWRGVPATASLDLSGTWTGLVTVARTPAASVSYQFSTNANDSAVFDITTNTPPGTVVGQLLVTSKNKVYAYVTFDGKQLRLSGTYSAVHHSLTLRGKDETGETVSVKIFKQ